MMPRLICNYPKRESISEQLLDFFSAELIYARTHNDHDLWLVSPWITESDFDLSSRGSFTDLFPGHSYAAISFGGLLKRFLDYGSTLHLVCHPPHQHINIKQIQAYREMKTRFDTISTLLRSIETARSDLIEMAGAEDASTLGQDLNTLQRLFSEMRPELDKAREKAKGRSNVVSFVKDLQQYAPLQVKIYYNERLHAKMIIGKHGGLFGSANLTHSGFNENDEVFAYETDPEILTRMRHVAWRLSHSKKLNWKGPADNYSAYKQFKRIIGSHNLKELASSDLPAEIWEVLELCEITRNTRKPAPLSPPERPEPEVVGETRPNGGVHSVSAPLKETAQPEVVRRSVPALPSRMPPETRDVIPQINDPVDKVRSIPYNIWGRLSHWAKEKNMFQPGDRRFIYQIYQSVKLEDIIDEKDAEKALSLYINARECEFYGPEIGYKEKK